MKIAKYCNQTATLQVRTGEDGWGARALQAPVQIPCRKETKQKFIRSKGETAIVAVTEILTTETVKIGDYIDNEEILAVEDIVAKNGTIMGYYAYPRPPHGFTP